MDSLARLLVKLADLGPWTPLLFVAAYTVASIVLAPAFLLTVAAGAVYGLWRGTLLAYVATIVGSSAVYGLAVPLARSRLFNWMNRDRRITAVRRAVSGDALWVMFLLRLSPVVPYVLLNYGLAFSGVRYRDFVLSSVGMLPTIVLYVYYGKVVGDVAKVAAGVAPVRGTGYYVLLAVGLLATALATTSIMRAARRSMHQAGQP